MQVLVSVCITQEVFVCVCVCVCVSVCLSSLVCVVGLFLCTLMWYIGFMGVLFMLNWMFQHHCLDTYCFGVSYMHAFYSFIFAPVQRNWACFTWKGALEIRSLLLLLLSWGRPYALIQALQSTNLRLDLGNRGKVNSFILLWHPSSVHPNGTGQNTNDKPLAFCVPSVAMCQHCSRCVVCSSCEAIFPYLRVPHTFLRVPHVFCFEWCWFSVAGRDSNFDLQFYVSVSDHCDWVRGQLWCAVLCQCFRWLWLG